MSITGITKQPHEIAGIDYPRPCILTDGQEVSERALLYDWEKAERNKDAIIHTDGNFEWAFEREDHVWLEREKLLQKENQKVRNLQQFSFSR